MPRLLLAALLLLVLAAPAQAARIPYGSDLSQPANLADSNPNDWAAWPTATTTAGPTGYTVTQQGEITQVSVKGTIPKPDSDARYAGRYPDFVFTMEVLRPQPDGSVKFVVATEALPFPFGGDDQRITTFNLLTYQARMCALPGDVVALATSGGYGSTAQGLPDDYFAQGYPVKMFSRVPTSSYGVFKQTDANNVHPDGIVPATNQTQRELLMRVTVGTGADARYTCRTKAEQAQNLPNPDPNATTTSTPDLNAVPTGVAQTPAVGVATLVAPSKDVKVRKGKAKVGVECSAAGACTGTLALRTYSGQATFAIPAGKTAPVAVKLNAKARKRLKRKGTRLTVKAMVANTAGAKSSLRFKIRH